jgi:hypothetical protein
LKRPRPAGDRAIVRDRAALALGSPLRGQVLRAGVDQNFVAMAIDRRPLIGRRSAGYSPCYR